MVKQSDLDHLHTFMAFKALGRSSVTIDRPPGRVWPDTKDSCSADTELMLAAGDTNCAEAPWTTGNGLHRTGAGRERNDAAGTPSLPELDAR